MTLFKGVGRKIFRGGPIRMEPVLTTKNGRIFEIWELLERVCENPGGGHGPPLPPLADAHDIIAYDLRSAPPIKNPGYAYVGIQTLLF